MTPSRALWYKFLGKRIFSTPHIQFFHSWFQTFTGNILLSSNNAGKLSLSFSTVILSIILQTFSCFHRLCSIMLQVSFASFLSCWGDGPDLAFRSFAVRSKAIICASRSYWICPFSRSDGNSPVYCRSSAVWSTIISLSYLYRRLPPGKRSGNSVTCQWISYSWKWKWRQWRRSTLAEFCWLLLYVLFPRCGSFASTGLIHPRNIWSIPFRNEARGKHPFPWNSLP